MASNPLGTAYGQDLTFRSDATKPVLRSLERLPDGQAQVTFTGTTRQLYEVEGSTDLQNWTMLGSAVEGSAGVWEFLDSTAPPHQNRFYRVVAP